MKGGRKEERKEGQGQRREVRRRQYFPGTEELKGKFQNFLQPNR